MGLYLAGWGVALIVCGLSAAINVREYASHSHCFLRTGPALSAIYIPFIILFLFMVVMFLLVRCAISNLDLSHGGHLSEGNDLHHRYFHIIVFNCIFLRQINCLLSLKEILNYC